MDIRLLESDVLFAFLLREPQAQRELRSLVEHMRAREPLHLVIDLSRAEIITSPSIGTLLLLRQLQSEHGKRLLLCQMRLATRCILRVVGLDGVFECVQDKNEALKVLGQGPEHSSEALCVGMGNGPIRSRQWGSPTSGCMELPQLCRNHL